MPCIDVKTNVAIPKEGEQELAHNLSQVMNDVMGKPEKFMMVTMDDQCKLYFGGSNAPAANLEFGIYKTSDHETWNEVTKQTTQVVSKELNIPVERVYIQQAEYKYWGYNGENFKD